MCRHIFGSLVLTTTLLALFPGCHPQQPLFINERGDLSHYIDRALEIEYPDVEESTLDEVLHSHEPLTLDNADNFELWDLSLEDAVRHTLANSQVIRSLGGRFASTGPIQQPQTGEAPSVLLSQAGLGDDNIATTFDSAIIEAGGLGPIQGVEQALSEFDAQVRSSVVWEKNDRPQNFDVTNAVGSGLNAFFARDLEQETGQFNAEISKTSATGSTFTFRNNTTYDSNNSPSRALVSDWVTNFEAEFRQPLLQGAGALYNRIAGPFNPFTGVGNPNFDGVVLARINTDISLARFEGEVRDLVAEVENVYWELYFAYRNLETQKAGRDGALQAWKKINAIWAIGGRGGETEKEAQARAQYFFFRSNMEAATTQLYRAENRLRYLMGLAMADGRLIRPSDEPTTAEVHFEWGQIQCEALARSSELRQQKWRIKQRELELVASKNHLLPRLDAFGRYRWHGFGDQLIDSERSGRSPNDPIPPGASFSDVLEGTNAFETLTSGDFQEWQLGLQLSMPLGFRSELAEVRRRELALAKSRAILKEQELEMSHQLGDAVRNLVNHYQQTDTNFNRRVAAEKEVKAVQTAYENGIVTLDLLLDAQRRRADAEIAFYRSLIDYNRGIIQVHQTKGSLLEYNNVYLAEGPWPGKAIFDAIRQARTRDAGHYLNYGYTRPGVISRGPYLQHDHSATGKSHESFEPTPAEEVPAQQMAPEDRSPRDVPDLLHQKTRQSRKLKSVRKTSAESPAPKLISPRGKKSANQLRSAPRSATTSANRLRPTSTPATRQASWTASKTGKSAARKLSYQEQIPPSADESNSHQSIAPSSAATPGWQRVQRHGASTGLRR